MNQLRSENMNDQGISTVEAIMVLPILLLIAFAGFCFSDYLKASQLSAVFAREAASMAYRECTFEQAVRLKSCLNIVRQTVQTKLAVIAPGTEVIVSVYVRDNNTGLITSADVSDLSGSLKPSKYSRQANQVVGIDNNFFVSQRAIAIGEVYLPHQTIAKNVLGIGSMLADYIYESVIV